MNLNRTIRNPHVSTLLVEHGAVVYDPDKDEDRLLNSTAFKVWESINSAVSIEAMAQQILSDFDGENKKQISDDIESFIRSFLDQGYLKHITDHEIPDTGFENWRSYTRVPRGIDISVTRECNLRCPYCFYDHTMTNRTDLSTGEWMGHFAEFKKLGIRSATITGGEALTRKDLFKLIEELINCRMRFSILTNGTLIDDRFINWLSLAHIARRCDTIQVSIDGSCSEIHDQIRGSGSFHLALNGLRQMTDRGLPASVRLTINKINMNDLDGIADLLLDEVGLMAFGTNDVLPIGAGCDNMKDIGLTPVERLAVMEKLAELNQKYANRITGTAGPVANWARYRDMELIQEGCSSAASWKTGYLSACGCVFERLAVHHDGSVTPCHMLADLVIGQLGKNSIEELWNTHPIILEMRQRRNIALSDVDECVNCQWNRICNGGCPSLPFQETGSFKTIDKHDCYKRFLSSIGDKKPWATSN